MSGLVYFLAADKAVKVGYTTHLRSRLAALSTANADELRLVGVLPGDRALERLCHKRLVGHRVRGEWFERGAALALLDGLETGIVEYELDERAQVKRLNHECATLRQRAKLAELELARARGELKGARLELERLRLRCGRRRWWERET
jgi:hypothetical protein